MSHPTSFASIRVVASDIAALVTFYEKVTGIPASWGAPQFAEIITRAGRIALAGTETLSAFGGDIAEPGANRTVIIEFLVADVDSEYSRLKLELELEVVQEPTTMPWGNRSLLLRDPDGNLVNLFTPMTPEAIERFGAPVPPGQS